MKILVLAAQKGGAGKTTLATNIAVEAERMGDGPVALIDTDPQGSLAEWAEERESPRPILAQCSSHKLSKQIKDMRDAGVGLMVIDTPPAIKAAIAQVISASDLVLIPTRPSAHDLRAVGKTIDIADKFDKPFVFVVNGAHPTARITMQAVLALSEHGTVAPSIIHQRTDFAASAIDGRAVMEIAGRSRSPGEIAALWQYLKGCLYGTRDRSRVKVAAPVKKVTAPIGEATA